MEIKSKYGYNTFIALTIVTASFWRTKTHAQDFTNSKDSIEIDNSKENALEADSATISFDEARAAVENELQVQEMSEAENLDSVKLEEIKQQLIKDGPKTVRFIAHFENIKKHAYFDTKARKWTIGFGNTTHPNGKPIRKGDTIKDEDELMFYFNAYLEKIAPTVAKYFPNYKELSEDQRVAVCDLFWNAGSGVLVNKEYDAAVQNLSEKQRQEVAQLLQNKNEKVVFEGQIISLNDIPEWRNLSVLVRMALQPAYMNQNIVKGEEVNRTYNEKFQILNEQQREDVYKLTTMLQASGLPSLPFGTTQFQSKWNPAQVNDSTIHYQGFVTDFNYTAADVPAWYKLRNTQQEEIGKLLGDANGSVIFNGRTVDAKNVPAIYFTSKDDRKVVEQSLGSGDLLVRKSTDNKKKLVLSNLAYELNLYALTKNPVMQERVATRMASYIRSRGKVVTALQKRANIRAQVFLGQITLNGEGENSINLETANLGAGYSVKISDLSKPKAICDSIKDCTYGKTYEDTLKAEMAHTAKRAQQTLKHRVRTPRKVQTRTTMARTGARGR